MYKYYFELTIRRNNVSVNFNHFKTIFEEAIDNVSKGISFRRSNKKLNIIEYNKDNVIICLESGHNLDSPKRSLSALSRYLIANSDFKQFKHILEYNHTLFNVNLIDYKTEEKYITDNEALKILVDLFMTKTNNAHKQYIKNYIEKNLI